MHWNSFLNIQIGCFGLQVKRTVAKGKFKLK